MAKKVFARIVILARRHSHLLIVGLLCLIFFTSASSFNFFTQGDGFYKWLSPDETANYVFSKYYSESGKMMIFEKYNVVSEDIIRPRSFRSDRGFMKPVSFLGIIIIYGTIAKYLTFKIIPYLTPFFAALGIFFFYLLIRKIFGKRNALISVFILAVLPPYLYYSARSMFHNVLFVSLLIIGLYFSYQMTVNYRKFQWKKISDWKVNWRGIVFAVLAGLFIGLSISTRTSELIWLGPALGMLWLFNIRKIGVLKLVVFTGCAGIALAPMMVWNYTLYGNPIFGGYPEMNNSVVNIMNTSRDIAVSSVSGGQVGLLLEQLKNSIFHFGFRPYESGKMVYYYFYKMLPWLFCGWAIGAAAFYMRWWKVKKKHIAYLSAFILSSIILTFYYGSWSFHDNPDPRSFTIGNSYTRYWLPIYIGAIPFFSYLLMLASRLIINKAFFTKGDERKFWLGAPRRDIILSSVRIAFVAAIAYFSIAYVLIGSDEGLILAARRQIEARSERARVLALTEDNSAIITKYHDKLFFPERKVIVGLFDDKNMNAIYGLLSRWLPLYYYNFTFPQKDLDYLNRSPLKDAGLQIVPVRKITPDFTLYRLNIYIQPSKQATSSPIKI